MLATPYGNIKILFDGKESSFDMIRIPENQKVWPDVQTWFAADPTIAGKEVGWCKNS